MKKVLFVTFIAVGLGCTGGFGSKANLAWGSQIAFVSDAFDPDGEIIIINSDGTVPQPVKSRPDPAWPTWSPDAKKIAFVADFPRQLYVMDANGDNLQRLKRVPLRARPAWHPDGRKIAFADFEELIVFDLETNTATQVFHHAWDNGLRDPAWSPGGSQIAFTIKHEHQRDIYVIKADGTGLRQLTKHPSDDYAPAWSPDGSQIAFCSTRDRKRGICLMDADGANFKRISDDGEIYPSWSPTGTHISFWLVGDFKVGVMRADGEDRQILFHGAYPSWRPDGSAAVDPMEKSFLTWGWVKLDSIRRK